MVFMLVLFFFKPKTAYELRIRDWSSDVCSSDLKAFPDALCDGTQHHLALHRRRASPNREGPSGCFDGTIDVNGVFGLNISVISAGGRVPQCDRLDAIAADPLAATTSTVGLARGKPASRPPGLVQRHSHDRLPILFAYFT